MEKKLIEELRILVNAMQLWKGLGELRGISSSLCTTEVKLSRIRSAFGWVTLLNLEVLTKQLTSSSFGGDTKLGVPFPCWK